MADKLLDIRLRITQSQLDTIDQELTIRAETYQKEAEAYPKGSIANLDYKVKYNHLYSITIAHLNSATDYLQEDLLHVYLQQNGKDIVMESRNGRGAFRVEDADRFVPIHDWYSVITQAKVLDGWTYIWLGYDEDWKFWEYRIQGSFPEIEFTCYD